MRKEWRQYDYENRQFKAAIKNCNFGPKDIDCDIHDYIANEDDFNEVVTEIRGNNDEVELNYDDLRRNDVVERNGFWYVVSVDGLKKLHSSLGIIVYVSNKNIM